MGAVSVKHVPYYYYYRDTHITLSFDGAMGMLFSVVDVRLSEKENETNIDKMS